MIDTIFFEKPILLIFIAAIVLLHEIAYIFKYAKYANLVLHIITIVYFAKSGATLCDILFLLLISVTSMLIFQNKEETK